MSTTESAAPAGALVLKASQDFWTDKQKAALAVLGIHNATNADLAIFLHYCQRTGLDPFSRQIYMLCRREKQGGEWVDKQTIQVGIDGFRVVRDRVATRQHVTVEYTDTQWCGPDGEWHDVWLEEEPPAAARMAVLKDGHPFPAVVRYKAFVPLKDGKPMGLWGRMDAEQLEKCAEVKALRRAFPQDLGGLYLDEEMPDLPAPTDSGDGNGHRPAGRVTAGEVLGGGRAAAAAGPGPAAKPAGGQPAMAGKTALARLDALLKRLQLGPDEDVDLLLEWWCGGKFLGTRAQVQMVTSILDDHLAACEGDTAEAASAIWARYRSVHGQDAAEGGAPSAPEPGDE